MKLAKTVLPPICAISLAFAFAVLATGSVFGADRTFSGTGRYLDPDNWSGKTVPTASDNNIYLTGTAGATNETEILYGGKYMHIGGESSGKTATLDVVNSGYKTTAFRMGHKAGGSAVYRQNGGWFYHGDSAAIGYVQGFKNILIDFADVAVTNNSPIVLGQQRSADGEREDVTYLQRGGRFINNTITVGNGNQAYACFSNVVGNLVGIAVGGYAAGKALVRIEDSPWTHTGETMKIGRGRMEFVNCPELTLYKHWIGNAAGACGELYLTNSVVLKNTYQSYIGSTANATGLVTLVDSVWTNTNSNVELGGGAGAFGRICLKGKSWYYSKGASIQLGRAAGGTGEFEFDGVPTNCLKKTGSLQLGSTVGCISHLIYRNIPDPFTPSYSHASATGSRSAVEIVNSTANVNLSSFSTTSSTTNWLNIVLNDNATLNWKCNDTLWFCNQNHTRGGIYATNSTVTVDIGSRDLKIEKPHSVAEFVFKDSTASFVAAGNVRAANNAAASMRLAVAGAKSDVTMGWLYLDTGTTTVDLDGGTLAFNRFVVANVGTQHLNFNGTTLKSRVWTDNWIGNGANMDARVLEGGAKFDTSASDVTIYPVLRHGGTAAKDGGIVKLGANKLTVKHLPTMTGDIVVEEGTLDLSAENDYVMAAGQMIGGAGTLKVGSGFVAGGICCDAAQANGLTVDGAVTFAPGSSVKLTGTFDDDKKVTLLSATSLTGAENLTVTDLPENWRIFVRGNTIKAGYTRGLMLLVR